MFFYMFFIFLVMLLLFLYMSYFFRRILKLIYRGKDKRYPKLLPFVIALPVVIPIYRIWDFWAVVMLHIAAISIFLDIINLIIKKVRHNEKSRWQSIYQSGVIPVMVTLLVLVYGYFNIQPIYHTEYNVTTDKAIRAEGYKVLFLSDLHFPTTMGPEKLQKYCQEMNESKPDLVILGGDIIDESTSFEDMQTTFETLATLESTYGTYYVYGNHDRGLYSAATEFTPEQLAATIESSGIEILYDRTSEVNDELSISGREDYSMYVEGLYRIPSADLLRDTPDQLFHILADHQPRDVDESAAAGFDLMLSGHTHAGQIWPTGMFNKVNYGQEQFGDMDVIVTSGIGGWGYAIRTGSHCEYVTIHIGNAGN